MGLVNVDVPPVPYLVFGSPLLSESQRKALALFVAHIRRTREIEKIWVRVSV